MKRIIFTLALVAIACLSFSEAQAQAFTIDATGIKFNENYYLDLAYQYNTANYSSFMSFYANDEVDATQSIESRTFGLSTNRHIAVVTLGYRF